MGSNASDILRAVQVAIDAAESRSYLLGVARKQSGSLKKSWTVGGEDKLSIRIDVSAKQICHCSSHRRHRSCFDLRDTARNSGLKRVPRPVCASATALDSTEIQREKLTLSTVVARRKAGFPAEELREWLGLE